MTAPAAASSTATRATGHGITAAAMPSRADTSRRARRPAYCDRSFQQRQPGTMPRTMRNIAGNDLGPSGNPARYPARTWR
jgi:hypothetical protein